jgi:hypothetical protein
MAMEIPPFTHCIYTCRQKGFGNGKNLPDETSKQFLAVSVIFEFLCSCTQQKIMQSPQGYLKYFWG